MKILITGGAGYIGSILIPKLLDVGHQVTVIDNLKYKQTSLLNCCFNEKFNFINADVRNYSLMEGEVAKHDSVIALAALVGAPLCNKEPHESEAINQDSIIWLTKKLSKNQQLLYPCTNSGYGIGESGLFCTEDTPLRPVSSYGIQKVTAEKAVLDAAGLTFRLATVFGASPRMRLDLLVNDFTYRAVYDRFVVLFEAHFKRNYLHIQDAADVFVFGVENYTKLRGNPYNVGLSEANLSKLELCEVIKKYVPQFVYLDSPIGEDPDKRNYIISNERIEKYGFSAKVSLDYGIQELIKVFKIVKRDHYANI